MFRVQQLGHFYHGAAVASLLREAMLLAGLELKLPGWCALHSTGNPPLSLTYLDCDLLDQACFILPTAKRLFFAAF